MKVNDDLYVLPVSVELPGSTMVMYLSLIVDPLHGPTLVDTGFPGEEQTVVAALEKDGFGVEDIRQIVLTHQDIDHIGGLPAIKALSDATVYAHPIEAPYIDGSTPIVKYPSEERLQMYPRLRGMWEKMRYVPVDQLVEGGAELELAGGVRVIFTPGHTPGHICLFLERSKVLIAGDALTTEDGRLNGPNPGATPDMPMAVESIQKLAQLEHVEAIVCYHGGLVTDDPLGQLKRVASELTA